VFNLKPNLASESSHWEFIRPDVAAEAVAVLIPLWAVRWNYRDEGRPKLFESYRDRLERLVPYIAYSIRESGLASSYDCRANKDRLILIMIGSDREKLRDELQAYLQLIKLPPNSTIATFAGDSPRPEETSLS
jgi:hypothetical protein